MQEHFWFFLYTISDFGAVQLLRYDTLTRSIATAQLANKSLALALGLFFTGYSRGCRLCRTNGFKNHLSRAK